MGEQIPEGAPFRPVPAVLSEIDAGDHDLRVISEQPVSLCGCLLRAPAHVHAPRLGDDAVGAPVGASVLNLENGTHAAVSSDFEFWVGPRSGNDFCHGTSQCAAFDVPEGIVPWIPPFSELRSRVQEFSDVIRIRQQVFVLGHDDEIRRGHRRVLSGYERGYKPRRAAREDEDGLRCLAAQPDKGVSRVAFSAGGDGAAVNKDDIGPGGIRALAPAPGRPCLTH